MQLNCSEEEVDVEPQRNCKGHGMFVCLSCSCCYDCDKALKTYCEPKYWMMTLHFHHLHQATLMGNCLQKKSSVLAPSDAVAAVLAVAATSMPKVPRVAKQTFKRQSLDVTLHPDICMNDYAPNSS